MKRFAVAYVTMYDSDIRLKFVNANTGFDALKSVFVESYQSDMDEADFLDLLYDQEIEVTYKEITQ